MNKNKYCPAGGIECENLNICGDSFLCVSLENVDYPNIGSISKVRVNEYEQCQWPSRQQPVISNALEDMCELGHSIVEETLVETIAAEIAAMPDAEFKANCEKLKNILSPGSKLEKYLIKQIKNITCMFNQGDAPGMEFAVNDAYEIYLSGCHAQAKRDREAVKSEMNDAIQRKIIARLSGLNVALAALAAAEIKGE